MSQAASKGAWEAAGRVSHAGVVYPAEVGFGPAWPLHCFSTNCPTVTCHEAALFGQLLSDLGEGVPYLAPIRARRGVQKVCCNHTPRLYIDFEASKDVLHAIIDRCMNDADSSKLQDSVVEQKV